MISFLEVKSDLPVSCENKNEMIGNVWTFHLDQEQPNQNLYSLN
jgi:hypothetical protein